MKFYLLLPALVGVLFLSGCVVDSGPGYGGRSYGRGSAYGYRQPVYVGGRRDGYSSNYRTSDYSRGGYSRGGYSSSRSNYYGTPRTRSGPAVQVYSAPRSYRAPVVSTSSSYRVKPSRRGTNGQYSDRDRRYNN